MSKVLAVGDVHTKMWIFDLVESVIDNYDTIVFCGDYADDWRAPGEKSVETWQRLKALMEKYPKVLAVQGNHDYIYAYQTPTKQSGYNQTTQFMLNNEPVLKAWLAMLPLLLIVDGVTYSHAGVDERWSGFLEMEDMWSDESPIWVRPYDAQYKNIPQVVGHTPQQTVTEVAPDVWVIDTFSTYQDGSPIGDGTMLEITDGKTFSKIKINANNNNTPGVEA